MGYFLSAENVKFHFDNTSQIVFEVTEKCNLACKYCTFGDLYSHKDNRGRNKYLNMDLSIPEKVLNYYLPILEKGYYPHEKLYISFYGGEPLMNFPLIKYVVERIEKNKGALSNINIVYSMTTNGVLLHKHIDFLVQHNFELLISLDGNRENNSYRVFSKSKIESFDIVFRNIQQIKTHYPLYYKSNVAFNAVLHNRNGLEQIIHFFENKLEKEPMFSAISPSSISYLSKDKYREMSTSIDKEVYSATNLGKKKIWNDYLYNLPIVNNFIAYVFNVTDNVYESLNSLLLDRPITKNHIPTGTCIPFHKKVFFTVRGEILPCERISHRFSMGKITEEGLDVDFENVASFYNHIYEKLSPQCSKCVFHKACAICVFREDDLVERGQCLQTSNNRMIHELVYKNLLLNHPQLYKKIIETTVLY